MSDTGSAAVLDRPATAPRAYGYMRVPCDVPDDKVRQLEKQIVEYAEGHGLCFAGFFSNSTAGRAKPSMNW